MRHLVLTCSIAAAAWGAAGCIITSSSSDEGHITASWSIKTVSPDADLGCPQGYDTASLYTEAADADGNPIGTCATSSDTCFIDKFVCADGAGTSAPLPAGTYIAWVAIEDTTGANVYAVSVAALVDITTTDKTLHADLIDNGGYFHFSWSLVGAQTGAALTCSTAGAIGGIQTTATIAGTSTVFTDGYDCGDGDDFTPALPAGNYVVAVDALSSANQPISGVVDVNATMADRNDVVELGEIMLSIDGL